MKIRNIIVAKKISSATTDRKNEKERFFHITYLGAGARPTITVIFPNERSGFLIGRRILNRRDFKNET